MRDYAVLINALKAMSNTNSCFYCQGEHLVCEANGCILSNAADAIEELLAAEPPLLWTDEPIEGTEFMTHSQGGRKGFEIHFRTDSLEKYKAVQEECRRQIDHAKPAPPKGGNHDN